MVPHRRTPARQGMKQRKFRAKVAPIAKVADDEDDDDDGSGIILGAAVANKAERVKKDRSTAKATTVIAAGDAEAGKSRTGLLSFGDDDGGPAVVLRTEPKKPMRSAAAITQQRQADAPSALSSTQRSAPGAGSQETCLTCVANRLPKLRAVSWASNPVYSACLSQPDSEADCERGQTVHCMRDAGEYSAERLQALQQSTPVLATSKPRQEKEPAFKLSGSFKRATAAADDRFTTNGVWLAEICTRDCWRGGILYRTDFAPALVSTGYSWRCRGFEASLHTVSCSMLGCRSSQLPC